MSYIMYKDLWMQLNEKKNNCIRITMAPSILGGWIILRWILERWDGVMQSLSPVAARQKGAIWDHLHCAWDWTHSTSRTRTMHSMQGRNSKLTKWHLWNGEHLLHCVVENSIPVLGDVGRSAVESRYKSGPSTLPWGTPACIDVSSE
jgi:hypothetical protein